MYIVWSDFYLGIFSWAAVWIGEFKGGFALLLYIVALCGILRPAENKCVRSLNELGYFFRIDISRFQPVLVKEYIDGSSIRQFQFYFTSREMLTVDVIENVQNSQFYELFAEWLRECSKERTLPELGGSRKAIDLRAVTQGYVVSSENSKAQYMVQCTLKYFKSN